MTSSGSATGASAGQARAHGAMLVYAFLVSTSFPVGAAITRGLDPVVLTCLRFALAALTFAAVVTAAEEENDSATPRQRRDSRFRAR